jgi:hypothetical protein
LQNFWGTKQGQWDICSENLLQLSLVISLLWFWYVCDGNNNYYNNNRNGPLVLPSRKWSTKPLFFYDSTMRYFFLKNMVTYDIPSSSVMLLVLFVQLEA